MYHVVIGETSIFREEPSYCVCNIFRCSLRWWISKDSVPVASNFQMHISKNRQKDTL